MFPWISLQHGRLSSSRMDSPRTLRIDPSTCWLAIGLDPGPQAKPTNFHSLPVATPTYCLVAFGECYVPLQTRCELHFPIDAYSSEDSRIPPNGGADAAHRGGSRKSRRTAHRSKALKNRISVGVLGPTVIPMILFHPSTSS